MTAPLKLQRTLLLLSIVAAYPLQAMSSAGVAHFTTGDVSVRSGDGLSSPLTKGKDVSSGQAIVTGTNGRAQLTFSDGGMVSLQPNTEFKITNYVNKADPKEDRFLVDLLRGSMRAITGLIGKRNTANYRVTTTTATIGIRGSSFAAVNNFDGSLTVTSEKDAIEVCSGDVCIGLIAGESAVVINNSTPPVRTVNRAAVVTPPIAQPVITVGNQTLPDGRSSVISGDNTAQPNPEGQGNSVFVGKEAYIVATSGTGFRRLASSGTAQTVFNGDQLVQATDAATSATWSQTLSVLASENTIFNASGTATNDNTFVGWGMWTLGSVSSGPAQAQPITYAHYVTGKPTFMDTFLAQYPNPTTSTTLSYNVIGSTSPTQSGVLGTFSSGSLNIHLLNSNYTFDTTISTSFGTVTDQNTTPSTSSTLTGSSGYVKGSFFGDNGQFVGLTYAKPITAGINLTGAVVFQKPGVGPF